MAKTKVTVKGVDFYINGKKTYEEIPASKKNSHGLLWNARFIQGIFDDKADPGRFARYGFDKWDAEDQTNRLIAALPEWYKYGLRAFTVGIQGGGPCFTINNRTIDNNPFGEDGKSFDPAYAARLDRLIKAADEIGMVVIVSYFYGNQTSRIKGGIGVKNAVVTASRWLKEKGYTNVIIEVANEMNINAFDDHKIVKEPEGMAVLLEMAREESGGMLVGCSGGGGFRNQEVSEASDVVLIHGNGQSRQNYWKMIQDVKGWTPDKPIVCNEDSQAVGQMEVAEKTHTSWGYYNNMTKQEPPTYWGVLAGEDLFFALRVAMAVGIKVDLPAFEDQYYLQGFEPEMIYENQRWIRLASLYPETINYVDFFKNGTLVYTAYDESFMINFQSNWRQGETIVAPGEKWKAEIHLADGKVITKEATT
jgi:hypothetical protein